MVSQKAIINNPDAVIDQKVFIAHRALGIVECVRISIVIPTFAQKCLLALGQTLIEAGHYGILGNNGDNALVKTKNNLIARLPESKTKTLVFAIDEFKSSACLVV